MNRALFALLCLTAPVWAGQSILLPDAKLEKVTDGYGLCDGPAWDGGSGLYIPDVFGGKLFRLDVNTGKQSVVLEEAGRISATFYAFGKLYVSDNGNSRIVILEGKQIKELAGHNGDAKKRPNDLVVDHHGRVYYTLTGPGEVWRILPDGTHAAVIDGIKTPNGITLSPNGRTLYVSASAPKEVWAWDLNESGDAANGRLFAKMDDGPAPAADGMTMDRGGNVYCTGAHDVWVWSPKGELIDKIATPTRPINAAFAGPDPQQLYITCMGDKATGASSTLYRIATRVSGLSPHVPTQKSEIKPNRLDTSIPDTLTAHLNIPYADFDGRKVLMDLFVPNHGAKTNPTVIVVHGGGWLKGDKTKFRAMALALAKCGYTTAAIEYRLSTEAKFPAGIQDCFAAVRFLRANATTYHVDPDRIGAVGGSAGGHLTGLMATGWKNTALTSEGGHGDQSSRIAASVVMAGPLQIDSGSVAESSMRGNTYVNVWIDGNVETNKAMYTLASADVKIDADSAPILFMAGEHDNPARNQPSRDKLKAAGVWTDVKIYKDGKHGCWNQNPWFEPMVADMDAFFQAQLKTK